jgi:hypothetical protein
MSKLSMREKKSLFESLVRLGARIQHFYEPELYHGASTFKAVTCMDCHLPRDHKYGMFSEEPNPIGTDSEPFWWTMRQRIGYILCTRII